MVWKNITIGNWNFRYTKAEQDDPVFEDCDEQGQVLQKVSGSFTKGYYINEKTGEKVEKAFKLINGKPSKGFEGPMKGTDKYELVNKSEYEDMTEIEHTYLADAPEIYDMLTKENDGKAVKFFGHFGRGYKAFKVFMIPSPLKGYCLMRAGKGSLVKSVEQIVAKDNEEKALKKALANTKLGANVPSISDDEMMAATLQVG